MPSLHWLVVKDSQTSQCGPFIHTYGAVVMKANKVNYTVYLYQISIYTQCRPKIRIFTCPMYFFLCHPHIFPNFPTSKRQAGPKKGKAMQWNKFGVLSLRSKEPYLEDHPTKGKWLITGWDFLTFYFHPYLGK